MSWTCVYVSPLDEAELGLRRYARGDCPRTPFGYHNAEVRLGLKEPYHSDYEGEAGEHSSFPPDDPRWPAECPCGYQFQPDDPWQVWRHRIYTSPGGEEHILRDAPPGWMWNAAWAADRWHGPDGLCLVVRLPDGSDWTIDGPASNGSGWTRTGAPPRITAHPSIGSPGYHGWLRDGVLSDDLEGRTYPHAPAEP